MELLNTQKYRSIPKVNISDDMIKVTLTMTLNEWHMFRKQIKGGKCEGCTKECAGCCD